MSKPATPSTFELAARFLAEALKPLLPYLSAADATGAGMKQLVAAMGWQLPEPVPPSLLSLRQPVTAIVESATKLANLQEKRQSSNPPDDTQVALIVTELLANLGIGFNAIFNLKTKLAAELPAPFLAATGIQTSFVDRFIGRLLIDAFYTRTPVAGRVFRLLGIIQIEELPEDPAKFQPSFTLKKLRWDRLPRLVQKPKDIFSEVYSWGTPDLKLDPLLEALQGVSIALNISGVYDFPSVGLIKSLAPSATPATADVGHTFEMPVLEGELLNFTLGLTSTPKTSPADVPGLALFAYGTGGDIKLQFPLTSSILFDTDFSIDMATGMAVAFKPNGQVSFISDIENGRLPVTGGSVKIGFIYKPQVEEDLVNLFDVSGALLQVTEAGIHGGILAADGKTDLFIEADTSCKFLFNVTDGDGFLQKILPLKSINSEFSFAIGFSTSKGVYFRGSSALEIHLPVHIALGPVSLEGMTIALKPADGTIPVELGADIKASLGPVVAIVQNLGIRTIFSFPDGGGNLGPLQMGVKFKPPNGAGLSVDAGGIKGGGFLKLDPDKGEYFGALELEFQSMFSLKAVGIINTKMPDGSEGFSMLIIITAEFVPIQLSFGFTLNGVGGIIGYNRTVKIDVLREGVKTNAIKSILFPENVVANIDRIVSDIKQIFPPYDDHFIIGPMGKLGWGTPSIITLELGLIIEIPVPRIAILGVLKALLPEENAPLLLMQINFLGVIDFENKFISFDASLYDSRLLFYTLTGDMAFRLSWGDSPFFILTVGGFHPAFKDAPGDLQNMRRIAISLLSGGIARITVQTYFAVTSNTVQFGAKAELLAGDEDGFNIYGFIGYDVLFQFEPFKFIADFAAGIALRRRSSVYMSIHVSGQLSGPSPFDARGEASVDFFFFSISVSFHETWGDRSGDIELEKADLLDLLTKEIADNRNWTAAIPQANSLHVSIKQYTPPADKVVVHPFGMLTFSERLVPLDIDIQKFGTKQPKDANHFEIKATDASLSTEPAKEQFAPANFFQLKDEDKLSRPSFEPMNSGFKISGSSALQMANQIVSKDVVYEFSYLRKKKFSLLFAGAYRMAKAMFRAGTKAGAVAKSNLSFVTNRVSANAPEKVSMANEKFAVANKSDMKLHKNGMQAGSYSEAVQMLNQLVKEQPGLKDQVQVVSNFELNPN